MIDILTTTGGPNQTADEIKKPSRVLLYSQLFVNQMVHACLAHISTSKILS